MEIPKDEGGKAMRESVWTKSQGCIGPAVSQIRNCHAGPDPASGALLKFRLRTNEPSATDRSPIRVGRSCGGLTLLETVMVLLLLSLVLGLASGHLSRGLLRVRLDSTVREVVATLRYAKSLARMYHEEKTVTIDLDKKTFGLDGAAVRRVPSGIDLKIVDPAIGESAAGRHDFVFRASGSGGGGTIVFSNETERRSVSLDPIVGTTTGDE